MSKNEKKLFIPSETAFSKCERNLTFFVAKSEMAALAAASIRDKRRRQDALNSARAANAPPSLTGSIHGGHGGRRGSEAIHDSDAGSRIVIESGRSSADWQIVRDSLLHHQGEVSVA